MGWLTRRLGYGLWGTVDADVPANPPQVTVSNTPIGVTQSTSPWVVDGPTASGQTLTANPVPIGGTDPNGKARAMLTDVYGNVQTVFGPGQADAFGRGRVSNPETLFNVNFQYDTQPLLMEITNTGGGSSIKTTNVSSVTLSTGGTTVSDGSIFSSHGYWRYEPGKSQFISITGVLGPYTQYVRKIIGYCGNLNGIFFDMDGTTAGANAAGATGKLAVTIRSDTSGSVVDTQVLQTNWNIDKMDGTGISGITLDFSKPQIFVIDFQWLGLGRVRWGFNVGGVVYYCHQSLWANVNSTPIPFMNQPNLPVRWQIVNDSAHAAAGATTMTAVCATVISEGGSDVPQTLIFTADNGVTAKSLTTTMTPMISLRPMVTSFGRPNRNLHRILSAQLLNTDVNAIHWILIYQPTLTGFSFADFATNYSCMQVDTSATGIILTVTGSTYSGTTKVITGAWTGGANGEYVGRYITLSGFTATANNGSWLCIASSAGSISLTIPGGDNSIAGTPRATGGVVVASGYVEQGTKAVGSTLSIPELDRLEISFTINQAGTSADIYSLCAQTVALTTTAYSSITWSEDR